MSLLGAADGMINATLPLPWLLVSGQPAADQFARLAAAGVRTVIDLRDPMEPRGFEEPETVRELGMEFVNVTVTAGDLDDASMAAALAALRAARPAATLMHCNSANRTGGPLLALLMIDEGLAEQDAVDAAMRAGLRSVELMEWATDYARRTIEAAGAS